MDDIVFLTTSNVKLAHARYLCRDYDVNIIQHKLLHYGKGYEEPRLFDREKLLEASAKDALRRWHKVSKSENRLYFLEDTSVKIHALSSDKKEVPGVDIKYWMRENSFNSLDKNLKSFGNNRKVTIYSHVVLLLTKDLKRKTGQEYKIFISQSEGTIIDKEIIFETNKLYPWLDNKSFNKWFVPQNESLPISMLSIEKADKYDFRKGAFDKMLQYLLREKKIKRRRAQIVDSKLTFTPIFLVSGPTCAGKTTIGQFMLMNYRYHHIEASDFMTMEFIQTHGKNSIIDIGEFAKEILLEKPYVVVKRILDYLETGMKSKTNSIIITGFRTPSEISYFKRNSPYKGNIVIVFLEADFETRFERWCNRQRGIIDYDKNKFKKINKLQNEMGLQDIEKMDNISTIENNQGLVDYFEIFHKTFLADVIQLDNKIKTSIKNASPKTLEDAILLTLAVDFLSKNPKYYTTTEISYKINQTFSHLSKHKDNVSRYFNQKIYPYYEVAIYDGKLKYKLTVTGFSEAISRLT